MPTLEKKKKKDPYLWFRRMTERSRFFCPEREICTHGFRSLLYSEVSPYRTGFGKGDIWYKMNNRVSASWRREEGKIMYKLNIAARAKPWELDMRTLKRIYLNESTAIQNNVQNNFLKLMIYSFEDAQKHQSTPLPSLEFLFWKQ